MSVMVSASASPGAAPLNPKDRVRILLFHHEPELNVQLSGAPGEGKYFLGLLGHLLQFGVEALQRIPQRIVFFAVPRATMEPLLEGKPPVARGQQRKKQRGVVAQAADRSGEPGGI